jgi:GT2 family glycosyltransferase
VDSQTLQAAPVVAVVVVHDPGPWFDEVIEAWADQDYPNLRLLFLVPSTASVRADEVAALLAGRLGGAFVRDVAQGVGYGRTANAVMRLVDGDRGLFLLCHDDVAPMPDAVSRLVEEVYRSNAGIVGPKLVEWDDPGVLQTVGLGVDRFGEVDEMVEPGEVDQEQHDAVRDVFALSSACLLVRADLFRELGGFDDAVEFYGEEIDLCWRAHFSGARVVVVPDAKARHRGRLVERRPDLNHELVRARSRMRTLATLTGRSRILPRSVQLVLLTIAEIAVGLFAGRLGEALASVRAMVGLVPRTPGLIARRRAIAPLRRVPEREVAGLQVRGSARMVSYLRSRSARAGSSAEAIRGGFEQWRGTSTSTIVAWVCVLVVIVVGSRTFINRGVPLVGEFLPLPTSAQELWAQYRSSWNPGGLGANSAVPTGWLALAAVDVATFSRGGLALALGVVGMLVVAALGIWRLSSVFATNRPRIAALVTYVAVPLVPGAIAAGRWSGLVCYGSLPWLLHLVRRGAGTDVNPSVSFQRSELDDDVDARVALSARERARRLAVAALWTAVVGALVPVVVPIVAAAAVVLAVVPLLVRGSVRSAGSTLLAGGAAAGGAWLLNLPWSTTWSWSQFTGPDLAGPRQLGLRAVASFDVGAGRFSVLALALVVPLVASVALARGTRLAWAVRGAGLALAFGALAVLDDRDALPLRLPEPGVVLVPAAIGMALAAASVVAAFEDDVRGRTFGWRQPLGVLANLAIAVAVLPGIVSATDGRWGAPRTALPTLLANQLPSDAEGDYRVLLVGDPRVVPVPAHEYLPGVAWAIVDDGPLQATDRWPVPEQAADQRIEEILGVIASGSTLRAGRLLAPWGIRFVVVPIEDGTASTSTDPLPVPTGLESALEAQLDLAERFNPPSLRVFENTDWMPVRSQLDATLTAASALDDPDRLVGVDLTPATPLFVGADHLDPATSDVSPGGVSVAAPAGSGWELDVGGSPVEARSGFGGVTVFDVATAGTATLRHESSGRAPLLVLQALLWLAAAVMASGVTTGVVRRRRAAGGDGSPLITFGPDEGPEPGASAAAAEDEREQVGGWINEVLP